MRFAPIVLAISLLAACAAESDEVTDSAIAAPAAADYVAPVPLEMVAGSPRLEHSRAANIAMMAGMKADICGALVEMARMGITDGPPPPDGRDGLFKTYQELESFAAAQAAWKKVRVAQTRCIDQPSLAALNEFRAAVAELKTELELVSTEPPPREPKTLADLELQLEKAEAAYRSTPDAVAEAVLAGAQAELEAAKRRPMLVVP